MLTLKILYLSKQEIRNKKGEQRKIMVYTYKELCLYAGVPEIAGGKQRSQQLKKLAERFNIQQVGRSKYEIIEEYDEELVELMSALNAPRQQILFDRALYKEFLDRGCQNLYLSNTDMLKLFKAVNENFPYSFDKKLGDKLGQEFDYMPEMAEMVYPILKQWIRRRIDSMNERKVVIKRDAFRLYSKEDEKIIIHNVPIGSDLEKECQALWCQIYDEVIGSDGGYVVNDGLWAKFEYELQKAIFDKTRGKYINLRTITVLSPATEECLRKQLYKSAQKLKALEIEEIRERAKTKIRNTSTLDTHIYEGKRVAGFTKDEREHFIDFNINPEPPFWFKEKLYKQKRDC